MSTTQRPQLHELVTFMVCALLAGLLIMWAALTQGCVHISNAKLREIASKEAEVVLAKDFVPRADEYTRNRVDRLRGWLALVGGSGALAAGGLWKRQSDINKQMNGGGKA